MMFGQLIDSKLHLVNPIPSDTQTLRVDWSLPHAQIYRVMSTNTYLLQ